MTRWLNHTADVSLEILCDRYEDLFIDFMGGLRELLVTGQVLPRKAIKLNLEEPAPADLLVAMGRRVLFYFETSHFVPSRLEVVTANPTCLTGYLWGEPFDPDRMEYHLEVKGITYHDLEVVEEGGRWRARVTFDV